MKRSLIILAATALVISCSNDSVRYDIEEQETPIGFDSYSSLATKAITSTNLEDYHTTFGVWGYKTYNAQESTVMSHYKVIHNDDNGSGKNDWDYDGSNAPAGQYLKYWDKMASQYRFDAYAPYSANASITNHVISISSGKYAANQNLQATLSETQNTTAFTGTGSTSDNASTDWMTATTTRNAAGTPARMSSDVVNLSFSHILTKVVVIVKTKTDFPKDIIINSLSLDNVYGTGSYDGTVWTTSGDAVSVAGVVGTIKDEEKDDDANAHNYYAIECLVMPQASAAPKFSVNYKIGNDIETFDVSKVDISNITSFAAGTVYTITATIGPDPIDFDCAVSPWTENSTGSVIVN